MNKNKGHCRLCAKNKQMAKMIDVRDHSVQERNLILKMKRIHVDITIAGMPKTICIVCSNNLEKVCSFIESVDLAQETLMKIYTTESDETMKFESSLDIKDYKEIDEIENDAPSQTAGSYDGVIASTKMENDLFPSDEDIIKVIAMKKDYVLDAENASDTYGAASDVDGISEFSEVEIEGAAIDCGNTNEEPIGSDSRDKSVSPISKRAGKKKRTRNSTACGWIETGGWADIPNLWVCSKCRHNFPDCQELRRHWKNSHESCLIYFCVVCNKNVSRHKRYIAHIRNHHPHLRQYCDFCNASIRGISFQAHYKRHPTYKYECVVCRIDFDTIKSYKEHISQQRHRNKLDPKNPPSLKCAVCEYTFTKISNLNTHMKIHKERVRSHFCDKCGKGYYNKNILADHIRSVHFKIRPYKCKLCDAAFKAPHILRRHVLIHEGNKPFQCEICSKKFSNKVNLQNHAIVHTDEMPFECEFCPKKFKFKTIWVNHQRQHTGEMPYGCTACPKRFKSWSNWNKHSKRIHKLDLSTKKLLRGNSGEKADSGNSQDDSDISVWKTKVLMGKRNCKKMSIEPVAPES